MAQTLPGKDEIHKPKLPDEVRLVSFCGERKPFSDSTPISPARQRLRIVCILLPPGNRVASQKQRSFGAHPGNCSGFTPRFG